MSDRDFLGTGWKFPPRFSGNGKEVGLVSGEEDIKEALLILFSTALEERLMHADFGSDMKQFMFEEVTPQLAQQIQQVILTSVENYEPRVEIDTIKVSEDSESSGHVLLIDIDYVVLSTNSKQNLVYPLYIF